MNVGDARAAAVDWVQTHAADAIGAYFYGSTVELPDDAELPPASDVDMTLVIEEPGEPASARASCGTAARCWRRRHYRSDISPIARHTGLAGARGSHAIRCG